MEELENNVNEINAISTDENNATGRNSEKGTAIGEIAGRRSIDDRENHDHEKECM